jgi:membrane protease YdiL (CAAX protease family)
MRALGYFTGIFATALGLVAIATMPAWQLVNRFAHVPFHRVGNRIAMLGLAIGLYVVARKLGVSDRRSMGFGLPRDRFLRELLRGLALGILFMLPLAALMLALGIREFAGALTAGGLLKLFLAGMGSGLAVAFIEESFLRGAMYSAVSRESGTALAVVSTSLLYAAVHFFARFRIADADVDAFSGIALLGGSLGEFARPLEIADAYLCLAGVGVLLALLRARTGSIAAGMGLHAGWVTVMLVVLRTTVVDPEAPRVMLLSQHDGFVGWLTLVWTAIAAVPLLAYYKRRQARAESIFQD